MKKLVLALAIFLSSCGSNPATEGILLHNKSVEGAEIFLAAHKLGYNSIVCSASNSSYKAHAVQTYCDIELHDTSILNLGCYWQYGKPDRCFLNAHLDVNSLISNYKGD